VSIRTSPFCIYKKDTPFASISQVLDQLRLGTPNGWRYPQVAGVESAWEQKKLEARKMPENAARREAAVPSVQCTLYWAACQTTIE
jgi:hypothetical protein